MSDNTGVHVTTHLPEAIGYRPRAGFPHRGKGEGPDDGQYAILRTNIKRGKLKLDRGAYGADGSVTAGVVTKGRVPPEDLEVYSDKGWKPIK